MLTGTGKGKKSGVAVVFAAGVFDTGAGQLAGAAFVVDARIEELYKETVHQICQTIRVADQFAEKKLDLLKRKPGGTVPVPGARRVAPGSTSAHHAFMNQKIIPISPTRSLVTGVGRPARKYQSFPRWVRMPGVSVMLV